MKKPLVISLFLLLSVVFWTGCKERIVANSSAVKTQYRDLGEYLQGVPGLQITKVNGNYNIVVRGTISSGSTEPLFVINNTQVGSYNAAAALVDPNDIDRVTVLKDVASTSSYGLQGANGVIIIRTKD